MGFGLDDIGSALTGGLISGIGNIIGSWASNSAKESLNKNILSTDIKKQKEYEQWSIEQDKAYQQWYNDLMFREQSGRYFDLSRKYAENTASWAVEGLRRAGINPLLALRDGNLASSLGNAAPPSAVNRTRGSVSRGSSSSGSLAPDLSVLSRIQQSHSASQLASAEAAGAKVDSEVKDATKFAQIDKSVTEADMAHVQLSNATAQNLNIEANTKEADARADLLRAQAVQTSVDAANAAKNGGLQGLFGAATRLGSELDSLTGFSKGQRAIEDMVTRTLGYYGPSPLNVHVSKEQPKPWYYKPVDRLRHTAK